MTKYRSKKRTYRKKRRKAQIPRYGPRVGYLHTIQTYGFQPTVRKNDQGGAPSLQSALSLPFALANLPQAPQFYNMFESFRIRSVTVKAHPLTNSSPGANNVYTMMSSIDYDDDSLSSVQKMLNRGNLRTHVITPNGGNQQHFSWFIKPRAQKMLFETATGTGYSQNKRSDWINTQDAKVPHYGLKIIWDTDTTLNSDIIWQFYCHFDLEFKGIKSAD